MTEYLTDEQLYTKANAISQTFEPGVYATRTMVAIRNIRRGDAVMIIVGPHYVTRAAVVVSVGTNTVRVCWADPATPGDFGRSGLPLHSLRNL